METRAPLITRVPVPGAALRTLAELAPAEYPVFFDSAAQGPLSRFSLLATAPTASLTRDARGKLDARGMERVAGGFLDNLKAWTTREHRHRPGEHSALPFTGGWFAYLGYELASEIEPRLRLPPVDAPYSAFALRVTNLAIHDLGNDQVFAVTEDGDQRAHDALIARLSQAGEARAPEPARLLLCSLEEDDPNRFLTQVRIAQEHIAAGDIYQANLSRGWRLTLAHEDDAARVYGALRAANPAPFAARVTWRGYSILSS